MRWFDVRHLAVGLVFLVTGVPQVMAAGSEGWNCRNMDFEIGCGDGGCVAAEAHTPMDIHLTAGDMSLCAYSGCWAGAPDVVTSSGRFATYAASGLAFSTAPENMADASVTVDTVTGTATVMVADIYAQPAMCEALQRD